MGTDIRGSIVGTQEVVQFTKAIKTKIPFANSALNHIFSMIIIKVFFNVGLPKEYIFFDHLLWSIFQSSSHNAYHKLPAGPLRAASMSCFHLLSL